MFDNGLPLAPTDWIRDGQLTSLLQTRHSRRAHRPARHPGHRQPGARPARHGGRSLDEMVAATDRGLLLTCLWYIREVDPQTLLLTGLTRDGVYLVEDGEVVGAVNNFRFNESPVDLLGRLAEVGAHGALPAARVGRLLHPHGDAGAAGRRLQHEHGEPGFLRARSNGARRVPRTVGSVAQVSKGSGRSAEPVYVVTDARRAHSEEVAQRTRRYLISMGIRTVCLVLAIFVLHGALRWVAVGAAVVLPWIAVVFANATPISDRSYA